MKKARLATFRVNDSWPHDRVKGHGAHSTKACHTSGSLIVVSLYFYRWRKLDSSSLHRRLATTRELASIVASLSAVGTKMMTLCKSFGYSLTPRSAKSVQRRAPKTCKKVKSSMSVLFGSSRPQTEVKNNNFSVDDSTKIACWLKTTSACSL